MNEHAAVDRISETIAIVFLVSLGVADGEL